MSGKFTKYRLYPDGEVVHQDDFCEKDISGEPVYDDYFEIAIPDEIVSYIDQTQDTGK